MTEVEQWVACIERIELPQWMRADLAVRPTLERDDGRPPHLLVRCVLGNFVRCLDVELPPYVDAKALPFVVGVLRRLVGDIAAAGIQRHR